jgi:hypothetical protein
MGGFGRVAVGRWQASWPSIDIPLMGWRAGMPVVRHFRVGRRIAGFDLSALWTRRHLLAPGVRCLPA